MATLSKHGRELDRREYASFRVAVMSDGQIMRNTGQGWKLWKRVKAGVDPAQYAKDAAVRYEARPAVFHEYVRVIAQAVSIEHRAQLHMLVGLMPSDPDGVWSEFNDSHMYGGASVDLDDCVALCRLYEAAARETTQEVA